MKLLLISLLTAPLALARVHLKSRLPLERRQSNGGDVIIQLFEWNWDSIAAECTNFIGPAGYKYIQVSPAQEHITGSEWWTSYQAVSYNLESKRGNRGQFQNMVSACNAAGVGVVVDVIVNHMAGIDSGSGVAGSTFTHYNYPGIYSGNDFHYCGTPGDDITDWGNGWQVQNCELVNLADLKTEADYVRGKIADHLKDLLSLGVAGFRIDAAKHVPVSDLQAILSQAGSASFITQEVFFSSGSITPSQYQVIGDVTEFNYQQTMKATFSGSSGQSISQLQSVGGNGFISGDKATVFVATHDTERNGDALNVYSPSNTYVNAHVFMLAYPYGHPMVLSSFSYGNSNDGAPNGGYGTCSGSGGANGFHCQHRWTQIAGMVKFRQSAGGAGLSNWFSPQANRIAFGRGSNAYVAINNADSDWSSTFSTSLADGTYCDVISSSSCDKKITVSGGQFSTTVPARSSVAIHVGSTSGNPSNPSTGQAIHPNGDSSKCIDVAGANYANGTPVQIYDCNGTGAQSWVIQPGSTKVQVAGTNFCLDSGSNPGNGIKMKIWQCYDGLAAQQWYFTGDNHIALEGQGQCLDLTDGSKANGNQLQTWGCSSGNFNQVWTL